MAKKRTQYWYKISVDAVRAWTTFLAVVVVGVGAFVAYRVVERQLEVRHAEVAVDEAETLYERLRGEKGLETFRDKYDAAGQHLAEARVHLQGGFFGDALRSAERSRGLLTSIADALRHRSPAGEGQFVSTQGRVEVRRGERGPWQPARSRVVLHPGDYVKTSSGASAEIMTVDGTLFTVRPETVILIGRTRDAFGTRSRTLSLESGWVNLSTSQTASRITTPGAEARIAERSEAVVAYDDRSAVGRYSAYRGSVTVESREGEKRAVGELQQVVQRGAELSAPRALPPPPTLIGPEDDLELVLGTATELVLQWRPVPTASRYALQISRNRLFVDNVIDVENRTKTTARLGIRDEGAFVWRVAALDPDGERGPWSTAQRFRVIDRPVDAAGEGPSRSGA